MVEWLGFNLRAAKDRSHGGLSLQRRVGIVDCGVPAHLPSRLPSRIGLGAVYRLTLEPPPASAFFNPYANYSDITRAMYLRAHEPTVDQQHGPVLGDVTGLDGHAT